jgi:hypothetical protein
MHARILNGLANFMAGKFLSWASYTNVIIKTISNKNINVWHIRVTIEVPILDIVIYLIVWFYVWLKLILDNNWFKTIYVVTFVLLGQSSLISDLKLLMI